MRTKLTEEYVNTLCDVLLAGSLSAPAVAVVAELRAAGLALAGENDEAYRRVRRVATNAHARGFDADPGGAGRGFAFAVECAAREIAAVDPDAPNPVIPGLVAQYAAEEPEPRGAYFGEAWRSPAALRAIPGPGDTIPVEVYAA